MRLYIFRHGETFANVEKVVSDGHSHWVQLTDLGKQQAQNLARELAPLNLPIIYSSPYDRALNTAQIVAAPNKTPIEILDDLREFNFGVIEGKTEQEAFETYFQQFSDVLNVEDETSYQVRLPQGESKEDALARFLKALNFIKLNCPFDTAGVATHGHVMALFYFHLYHRIHKFENCACLSIEI